MKIHDFIQDTRMMEAAEREAQRLRNQQPTVATEPAVEPEPTPKPHEDNQPAGKAHRRTPKGKADAV